MFVSPVSRLSPHQQLGITNTTAIMAKAETFSNCFLKTQKGGIGFQEVFHPDFYFRITAPHDMGTAILDQSIGEISNLCAVVPPMFFYLGYYNRIAFLPPFILTFLFVLFRAQSVNNVKTICTVLGVSFPVIFVFRIFPAMQRDADDSAKSILTQVIVVTFFFSLYWPLAGKVMSRQMNRVCRSHRENDLGLGWMGPAKKRLFEQLNRVYIQGVFLDLPRVFYGRALLANCQIIVFFLMMTKVVIMALWSFAIAHSDAETMVRMLHPDEAAREGWGMMMRLGSKVMNIAVRMLEALPRKLTIAWTLEVDFDAIKQRLVEEDRWTGLIRPDLTRRVVGRGE